MKYIFISTILFSLTNCFLFPKSKEKYDPILIGALLFNISRNTTNVILKVESPVFSPTPGHYNSPQNISISSQTSDSNIFFTTDGTNPTMESTKYESSFHIWSIAGRSIKAFGQKADYQNSEILSGVYSYPPLKTGQTTVYKSGDNGSNQSGVGRGYMDNGNGTVIDNATGLVWQKCSKGSSSATDCSGITTDDRENWANAGSYCKGLTLANKTWRLPSRIELETLINFGVSNPSIDITTFPNTAQSYWSSTTYAPNAEIQAWNINFQNGSVDFGNKNGNMYVRCVSNQ